MDKVMEFLVDLETIIFKIFEIIENVMIAVDDLQDKAAE